MDEKDISKILNALIEEIEANSIKDLGKIMQLVKERYPGQLDMKKAADIGKSILTQWKTQLMIY